MQKKIIVLGAFFALLCMPTVFAKTKIIEQGNLYGLMDENEKVLIKPQYQSIGLVTENRYLVSVKGKIGLIDKSNKVIIPINYDTVLPLYSRDFDYRTDKIYYTVGLKEKESDIKATKQGIFDDNGKEITKMKYKGISRISKDSFAVSKDGEKVALANVEGKILTPFAFKGFQKFNDEIYIAAQKDGVKIVKADGSVGFKKYDDIAGVIIENDDKVDKDFSYILLHKKDKQSVADFSGKQLFPFKYKNIEKMGKNRYIVRITDKIGVIDEKGKFVIKPECDTFMWNATAKAFKITQKGLIGLADENAKIFAEPIYGEIVYEKSTDSFLAFDKDGRYRIYRTGKRVDYQGN